MSLMRCVLSADVARVTRLCRRIAFLDWRIDVSALGSHWGSPIAPAVRVCFLPGGVRDTVTGEAMVSGFDFSVSSMMLADLDDAELLRLIRGAIVRAVTHEVDERLLVDGEAPFNPHRPNDEQAAILARLFGG